MPYKLTLSDMESITDVDLAFGTVRFLPAVKVIPQEFLTGNAYTKLASEIFYEMPLTNGNITLHEGATPDLLNRVIRAHLKSFAPKYEHKIAGVGFMISKVATLS